MNSRRFRIDENRRKHREQQRRPYLRNNVNVCAHEYKYIIEYSANFSVSLRTTAEQFADRRIVNIIVYRSEISDQSIYSACRTREPLPPAGRYQSRVFACVRVCAYAYACFCVSVRVHECLCVCVYILTLWCVCVRQPGNLYNLIYTHCLFDFFRCCFLVF